MTRFKENIDNLTSLWKSAGEASGQYVEDGAISYCVISDTDWPNRAWLTRKATSSTLEAVTKIMRASDIPMTLSHWSDFDNHSTDLIEGSGFTKRSEQIGMSLVLERRFSRLNRIRLERVINKEQASVWESLYPQNFGYGISLERLFQSQEQISFFLIYSNKLAIGTVCTISTGNNIGIHGLGIVPEYRKQGFAEEVMAVILNQAIEDGKKLALLQASKMGINLYLKLGFSKDFLMQNFILNANQG